MEYIIILEKSKNGFSAYPPDLPGVGIAAKTKKEALHLIKEAIKLHLEDFRSRGLKIPKPTNEAVSISINIKAA